MASCLFFRVRVVFAIPLPVPSRLAWSWVRERLLTFRFNPLRSRFFCGLGKGWSLRNPSGLLMLPPLVSFVGLVVCLPLGGLVSLPFWGGTSRSFLVGANGLPGRGRVSLLGDQGCGLLTPPHPRR